MAHNTGLTRVLTQRRGQTSLDVEREHFEKTQTAAISKAINSQETPVKEKHVRMAIIGTFHEKSASTFWSISTKLPLQGNPIVCWKFCYTLHKLLREGHAQAIADSYKYVSHLGDLGKLWGHLREGYGKLIASYCKLLICKLHFHKKYPRFPGNLQVTQEVLDSVGENDVNIYFELSTEFFDYTEEILNLQAVIFGSLDMSRANSMTSTGQCRIHPLIPCIQDSSQLYDYTVKTMFKLHSSLPPDTLSGHRERFVKQFKILRQFYFSSGNLQYFKYLIHVPQLPESPPNFLIASDYSSHISPVVIIPQQQEDDRESLVEGVLIDTEAPHSEPELLDMDNGTRSPDPDIDREKDQLIESLMRQIERLKQQIEHLRRENERLVTQLRTQISDLETEVLQNKQLAEQAYQDNEELRHQLQSGTKQQVEQQALILRVQDTEKKAKVTEEKFQKMRDVYGKLREEHITLLRTHAEVNKQLNATKTANEEEEQSKKAVEEELMRLKASVVATEQMQQAASDKDRELSDALAEQSFLQQKNEELGNQLSSLRANSEELKTEISTLTEEKCQIHQELQNILSEKMCLTAEKTTLEDANEKLKSQNDSLLTEVNDLRTRLDQSISDASATEANLKQKLLDGQLQLLVKAAEEAEAVVQDSLDQFDNPQHSTITCTPEYLLTRTEPLISSLERLCGQYEQFQSSPERVDDVVCCLSQFSHLLADCIIQGKATSHIANIEQGEELASACKQVGGQTIFALTRLKHEDWRSQLPDELNKVRADIEKVIALTEALVPKLEDIKTEELGDMVEKEMHDTMESVEEAAKKIEEMLNKSRSSDSGITLEVNERILDSCNALMMAIKFLIERSRELQNEIAVQGRGAASTKEFYKRNHRWTEGLMSAAKAVGFGAKVLVDAADKVVAGEGKFEELMVCSQEIAASTAQLVVASKVKADRHSEKLRDLSKASSGVSEATGRVVASAKTAVQMIEDRDVMDFSKLSLHAAKRLEMDSQVRVLELESSLSTERRKLAGLRKQHYQLAGASEGWEEEDIQEAADASAKLDLVDTER